MRYLMRSLITLLWLFIYSSGFAQKDITSQPAKRADLAITNITVIKATSNPSTGLLPLLQVLYDQGMVLYLSGVLMYIIL